MLFDREPKCRIGSIIDDNDTFVVWVLEPRHRIERLLEHLRRFIVSGDMD